MTEKYFTIARAEGGFPPSQGEKPCNIVRTLYGLPIAGAPFRAYLTKHLRSLGYVSGKADPDVHMRRTVKPDGTEYYEYPIAYVDGVLCCGMDPRHQLEAIGKTIQVERWDQCWTYTVSGR